MCPSSRNVLEANRSDGEQFADRGNQYKPGIFYHNKFQKKATEESERSIEKSEKYRNRNPSFVPRKIIIKMFVKRIWRIVNRIEKVGKKGRFSLEKILGKH
ncbi:peptide-methionine (S)-S-oxide reductase [Leptospira borgpetersenii]|uniref:peptide-methionine (S)-S-oxide reductase n=1 Tax=Leptospira borgpetersenii TaxID=174 RepID=UPI000773E4C6|nr:peptide-methionine (S)-S-oxide reductase [Leptospira borgpetersenii]MBE8399204.1 peptide-methionine (S)-S-oxide reductase [Leptospira borgpetersenii serovar Tarassovi]MBE8402283.1 peptide-methionine (S)-S-oxide reductase [Leptospira borgpetersenii serovar Tarassovi]MBE8405423.1 peptide-methionine (S)-S-oxide reductase [Leptospira borgpetersenii serovar Tarassovi]MBE8411541.1 peptide-methionine (S)-S-oxide reductase [Leptospira borgpetersenii serovar Tarassovi]MBE8414718.1 peptide-methionine